MDLRTFRLSALTATALLMTLVHASAQSPPIAQNAQISDELCYFDSKVYSPGAVICDPTYPDGRELVCVQKGTQTKNITTHPAPNQFPDSMQAHEEARAATWVGNPSNDCKPH